MGDEFFAAKAGPAATSAAAAAAANAAAAGKSAMQMMPPPMGMPFDMNDAHSPMKVPVPSEGRGKKGGGRGGGKTPNRNKGGPQPPPASLQQPEWDVTNPFQPGIPPAYGMTGGMAYPPAPAAGMPAPYPMPCPPMPMYGMMPFMPYPPAMPYGMPGMPAPSPAPGPEKSARSKAAAQGKGGQKEGAKKRRGKTKGYSAMRGISRHVDMIQHFQKYVCHQMSTTSKNKYFLISSSNASSVEAKMAVQSLRRRRPIPTAARSCWRCAAPRAAGSRRSSASRRQMGWVERIGRCG